MAANEARGEVEIRLGDARYTLTPTYAAIARAEALAEAGIVRIANRLWEGDVRLSDLAALVAAGVGEERLSLEAAGEAILAEGLSGVIEPLGRYLAQILDPRGEAGAEPAQEKKEEAPPQPPAGAGASPGGR